MLFANLNKSHVFTVVFVKLHLYRVLYFWLAVSIRIKTYIIVIF